MRVGNAAVDGDRGVGSYVDKGAGIDAQRRIYTVEYKLKVLRVAETLRGGPRGQLAAFLRAEGLRASQVARWRKQSDTCVIGRGKRGRRERSRELLLREIRQLKYRLEAMKKRALQAEELVLIQMKYVKAAALKLERKDRGLLSRLIARVEQEQQVTSVCEALALTRRDFYRTIQPLIRENTGTFRSGKGQCGALASSSCG